ncbi:MAG: DUF2252 domain-containing protein [Solimonas sp.]
MVKKAGAAASLDAGILQRHAQPIDERRAAGKALRERCPRGAHAGWKGKGKGQGQGKGQRADPIDLLIASSKGRIESLLPLRHARMAVSPFTFYRGAAAVMAADLARTPDAGIAVQVCGDCHLLNFGGFATPERHLVFDINDFDETAVAPWEWDIKRLAASFVIAGRDLGFGGDNCREAAWHAVRAYREHMAHIAETPVLEAWYAVTELSEFIAGAEDKEYQRLSERALKKATARSAHDAEFAKLAYVQGERPLIKDDPPLIYHELPTGDAQAYRRDFDFAYRGYLASLPPARRLLLERYSVADVAVKVVGVGSVGTACGIVLLMSGGGDPLFLQYKEARRSVLEPYAGRSPYANRGERVVVGQQIMQSASDIFLGWTRVREGRHYYLRQLRDAKIKPTLALMRPLNLRNYAKICGRVLARAHSRSGDAAMLSGYLGSSSAFEDAMLPFATGYADQNERDHDALIKAIRGGRIEAAPLEH